MKDELVSQTHYAGMWIFQLILMWLLSSCGGIRWIKIFCRLRGWVGALVLMVDSVGLETYEQ